MKRFLFLLLLPVFAFAAPTLKQGDVTITLLDEQCKVQWLKIKPEFQERVKLASVQIGDQPVGACWMKGEKDSVLLILETEEIIRFPRQVFEVI